HPLSRIHGAAALSRAAVARRGLIVVIQVVVPDQFFSRGNVADGEKPDAAFDLVDFAIGVAGMVQVGTEALSIDHGLTVVQSIKVSAGNAIVPSIGFFHGDALTGILDNAGSFA